MAIRKHVPIMLVGIDGTIMHEEWRDVRVVQTTMSEQDARDTLSAFGFNCDILIVLNPDDIEPKGEQHG